MDARTTAGGAVDWLRLPCVGAVLRIATCLAMSAHLAGCQADPNMQLVERELRLQDSHIFELEEHLADCHSTVAEYRREIAALRRQVEEKGPSAPAADDYYGDWDPDTRLRPPRPGGPSLPEIDEGDEMSSVPLGPSDAADLPEAMPLPAAGEPPEPTPAAPAEGASFPPPGGQAEIPASGPLEEELPPPELSGSVGEVEQIGLRLMVRYHADENTPVELQALVEPQDSDADQVLAEGDVSVMVVAADGGTERPLARWDFAEEEARGHWKRSRLGTGMLFQLPWPGTPQPGKYRLWVRMVGDDGRKHLSSADFEVQEAALAQRPTTPPPTQLVLPEPESAGEPDPSSQPGRPPGPDDEPAREPERLGNRGPGSPAELPAAPPTGIAWKASVEAARLPRLPQPQREPLAVADVSPTEQARDNRRLVPWSPERPNANISDDVQTADISAADDWSPYR